MNESLILVLSTIWSLFIMYVIVWKLKMNQFKSQMASLLTEAIEDRLEYAKSNLTDLARDEIRNKLKETLVEAKVVDRSVTFRFLKEGETL